MPKQKSGYELGSATDIGVREENQDAIGELTLDDGTLLVVVCDGMGGHAGGSTASRLAVEAAKNAFRAARAEGVRTALERALTSANDVVFQKSLAQPELKGMGTTGVAIAIEKDIAFVAHVGDSRAYRIRPRSVEQLTREHTNVQRLVDSGLLSSEEARSHPEKNILSRVLGARANVDVEVNEIGVVKAGDRFLLCSDGLTGPVEDDVIAAITLMNTPAEAVRKLIALAKDRGGDDNISVQVVYREGAHPPSGKFDTSQFRKPAPAAPQSSPQASTPTGEATPSAISITRNIAIGTVVAVLVVGALAGYLVGRSSGEDTTAERVDAGASRAQGRPPDPETHTAAGAKGKADGGPATDSKKDGDLQDGGAPGKASETAAGKDAGAAAAAPRPLDQPQKPEETGPEGAEPAKAPPPVPTPTAPQKPTAEKKKPRGTR